MNGWEKRVLFQKPKDKSINEILRLYGKHLVRATLISAAVYIMFRIA
jgi:hypothetical protein